MLGDNERNERHVTTTQEERKRADSAMLRLCLVLGFTNLFFQLWLVRILDNYYHPNLGVDLHLKFIIINVLTFIINSIDKLISKISNESLVPERILHILTFCSRYLDIRC